MISETFQLSSYVRVPEGKIIGFLRCHPLVNIQKESKRCGEPTMNVDHYLNGKAMESPGFPHVCKFSPG